MVRKKPKTPQKKVPEKGIPHVLDEYFTNVKTFLINNKHEPRLVHNSKEACPGCHCGYHELHIIPCFMEICSHCFEKSWECGCESWLESYIVCEV